jgi:hypothetical protein
MHQKQAGTAAVPRAGLEEGADGNAVGLPDLQPAVLDPPVQATPRWGSIAALIAETAIFRLAAANGKSSSTAK